MSENVAIVRGAFEALARDDVEGLMPFLDEEVEWRNPEESPIAGVSHGREGVRDWFVQARESWAEMRFVPEDFIEPAGSRVLVLVRGAYIHTTSGRRSRLPGLRRISAAISFGNSFLD